MLNAFRHHCGRHRRASRSSDRCSTPFGITAVGTSRAARQAAYCSRVLNAFRHHCGRHTCRMSTGSHSPSVLNAFRHHCGRHCLRGRRTSNPVSRCSTPFGITEVGTRDSRAGRIATSCAQRLSASLRSAPRAYRVTSGYRALPCSTPFGITEVGTSENCRARSSCDRSAQRLSASLRSARPSRCDWSDQ